MTDDSTDPAIEQMVNRAIELSRGEMLGMAEKISRQPDLIGPILEYLRKTFVEDFLEEGLAPDLAHDLARAAVRRLELYIAAVAPPH